MKKNLLLFVCLLPVILYSTVIPAGDVSGVWNLAGSPYYIDGEIAIQSGTELEIEPGVDVIFNAHYKFLIYGRIVANGTEADSIRFTPLDYGIGWHGLRFIDGNLSSLPDNEISYCQFKKGFALGVNDDKSGGAIFCSNTSNLAINNSLFFQNYCENDGGGIYVKSGSDIQVNDCMFRQNSCGFFGAGMAIYGSGPIITGCTFKQNDSSVFAGGLTAWDNSFPEIYNSSFIENTAGACGGAYFVGSNIVMANVLFVNNSTTFGSGGACGVTNCTTEASNITSVNNESLLSGGAFWVNGGTLNLYNSILWNNLPEDIMVLDGTANASNCCIMDGTSGTAVISDDPQFIDPTDNNFRLEEISPCIDSGDETLVSFALPAYDLDGNDRIIDGDLNGTAEIDMGVFEFAPTVPTTGYISGTVTDSEGSLLENAEITAGAYIATTDLNGEYEIEVEAGDYTVSCFLAGYQVPANIDVTVVVTQTIITDFVLELLPTIGFISGTVIDSEGILLENAEITAGAYFATTDLNGEYEIEVEAGDYTVSCYLAGYEVPDNIDVTVVVTQTVTADFVLIYIPTTGFITGTVTDTEGILLENAEITAGAYTITTDVNGEYEIEAESGNYTVSCFLAGYGVPDNIDVTVIATQVTTADFVLIAEVNAGNQLLPKSFELLGNYPNPFNPTTKIQFSIPQNSMVNISIFNSNGQFVSCLCAENLAAGTHQVVWNGEDQKNETAASGIYLYKISTETETKTGRMLMLK